MIAAPRPALAALLIGAAVLLAGCESREAKAERFYQSALALLESGDEDRALVELRNVFQSDGFHKEARQLYADLQLGRGEVAEAYGQYLRLVEQYPDTPEARATLAEIAMRNGDWEEADRHGQEALRLAPDEPRMQAIGTALAYRDAVAGRDDAAAEESARQAQILLAAHPDLEVARRVAIDWIMAGDSPQDAMPEIDRALEADPQAFEFHVMRARLLDRAGDLEGTGAQLRRMYELFPDNEEVQTSLMRWHLAQGDLAGAEAFLRQMAGEPTGAVEGHATLVQFLKETQGPEAAQAELGRLAEANADTPNADFYRALSAGLDFDAGRREEGVAAIEAILAEAEPSDQTRRIKVMLANMLAMTGNQTGARGRVEEVLVEDPTNVDALRMRAGWAIREDRPGEAIVDLRTALSQNPRDVDALTLMAEAHEREGSLDLAGERLAMAVEVSDSAPAPSTRYAEFLLRQGRPQVAQTVLTDARAANPGDLGLAMRQADLWLQAEDFAQVEAMVAELEGWGTPEATEAARTLRAATLLAQNRTEDGIEVLRAIAEGEGNVGAVAEVVETLVREDRAGEARAYLEAEILKRPDDPELRLMSASLSAVAGDLAEAEAGYRALLEEDGTREQPVRLLYGLLLADGRPEEATAVLDAGLAATPASGVLRWIKAGELEQAGDIDGAIALYEELYAEDSSNVIVANNLASLISAHRDDPESIERAYAVARRLRGSDEPAFQDTYGWIAFRRGEVEEAVENLEPAAEGLPDDPLTQFHLGMAYAAAGRTDDAVERLGRAVELWGEAAPPQLAEAEAKLAELGAPSEGGAAPAAPAEAGPGTGEAAPAP